MSIKQLGFRDLQYLIAGAEHSSITRAAEACSITQPALSERLKRIESTLGVALFERSKRTTKITEIGESLIIKARQILDQALEFDEIASRGSEPLSGVLRVGIIATLGPYLMPHLLPSLRKNYPKLELVLQEGLTDSLATNLMAGGLDFVIAAAPLKTPGVRYVPLFHEPFVLAAPINHPMANRDVINAADLSGDEMVLLEEGHCLSGQALDVCPARRRANANRLHATTLETLRHMVATGAGYTLLPALAVGEKPPLQKLVRYRQLGGEQQYGREIVLAWRTSNKRRVEVELLSQLIVRSLPRFLKTN